MRLYTLGLVSDLHFYVTAVRNYVKSYVSFNFDCCSLDEVVSSSFVLRIADLAGFGDVLLLQCFSFDFQKEGGVDPSIAVDG